MPLQDTQSPHASAPQRQDTPRVPSLAKNPAQALSLDEALHATRTAFRNDPEGAIASFLATPPPDLASARAIVDAAIPLMWCNTPTTGIAARFGLTYDALVCAFYSSSLYSRNVRAAIEQEISREGSKEITRILEGIETADLSQFHTEWSKKFKRPNEAFLRTCELVVSGVVHGSTFQETRQALGASQAKLAPVWVTVHSSVAEILAEKAVALEAALQSTWIKHWLPQEEWQFYAGRAKDRLTLRELGPRFDVSGEFARRQLQTLTDRFPPLRSLIHIHEISKNQRFTLIAKRAHRQAVHAERAGQLSSYIETRTDIPENIRDLIKNAALRNNADLQETAQRCDLYLAVVAAFDAHPRAFEATRYRHVLVSGLATMSTLASNTPDWVNGALTTALAIESAAEGTVTNTVLRRLFSRCISSPEDFRLQAEEILQKVTAARATVAEAIGAKPRAKLCLRSIQRALSVLEVPRARIEERAERMYETFLKEWDGMIKAGLPEVFSTLQAHKALITHRPWRTQFKRNLAPAPAAVTSLLTDHGIVDDTFVNTLQEIRCDGGHSARLDHLVHTFFTAVETNYRLTRPDLSGTRVFIPGSETTVRKLIKHALLQLDESLLGKSPAQDFTSYILLSTKVQLIAMGYFKR